MLGVRNGTREAFEILFERHHEAVWRFFRRRVNDRGRAEELVQDVFVALLQNAGRYQPTSAFRSYLFAIAYNLLHADRRKPANREVRPLAADVAGPEVDPDCAIWVQRALASLEADDREIVMLREYEELSYQEIADLLRIPLNTVRSRLFRARMELKGALAGGGNLEMKGSHGTR
jgi:RNA polymerase sigma-70 factor (ECF subfamily)